MQPGKLTNAAKPFVAVTNDLPHRMRGSLVRKPLVNHGGSTNDTSGLKFSFEIVPISAAAISATKETFDTQHRQRKINLVGRDPSLPR